MLSLRLFIMLMSDSMKLSSGTFQLPLLLISRLDSSRMRSPISPYYIKSLNSIFSAFENQAFISLISSLFRSILICKLGVSICFLIQKLHQSQLQSQTKPTRSKSSRNNLRRNLQSGVLRILVCGSSLGTQRIRLEALDIAPLSAKIAFLLYFFVLFIFIVCLYVLPLVNNPIILPYTLVNTQLMTNRPALALLLLSILHTAASVEFILKPNIATCTVLVSSFDPIKVQAIFPTIGSKREGEHFKVELINDKTRQIEKTIKSQDNRVLRENFYLEFHIIYSLCFTFVTKRQFGPRDVVFVNFVAEEHFQAKINKIDIPKELANESNLKIIYETGSKMLELNGNTIQNQKKERDLEDKLVDLSLHKGSRIVKITLIECLVIVISGVYQICALRRFLIQKNLY